MRGAATGWDTTQHRTPSVHAGDCLQVFKVLGREGVNVKMLSQGASKTNISMIVSDNEGKRVVRALHTEFFHE